MIPCLSELVETSTNRLKSECKRSELAQIQNQENKLDHEKAVKQLQLQFEQSRQRLEQEKSESRHMLSNQQEIEQQERRIWERERSQNLQTMRWQENEMQVMDRRNREYEQRLADLDEKFFEQGKYQQALEGEVKEVQNEHARVKLELLREKQRYLQMATEKTELEIKLRTATDDKKSAEHQNKQGRFI